MIDLLLELEAELARAAPGQVANLRPGLDPRAIDALVDQLPQPVPDELRELYAWHDGTDFAFGGYRAELFRGGMFMPLEEALSDWTGGVESTNGDWDPRWHPVFTDEHAQFDAVVCGQGGGAMVSFSYLDLPAFDLEYPSLPEFIRSLIRRWHSGVYTYTVERGVSLDVRGLAALRREEDGMDPDVGALVQSLRAGTGKDWSDALIRLRTRLYPTAVPALIDLLFDSTANSRTYAAELLGAIGGTPAVDALRRVAADEAEPDRLVKDMAAAALRDMDGYGTSR